MYAPKMINDRDTQANRMLRISLSVGLRRFSMRWPEERGATPQGTMRQRAMLHTARPALLTC